jgi:hypothetical protein
MSADALGHRVDARVAAARHSAIGDDDVCFRAGAGETVPIDQSVRPGGKQPPFSRPIAQRGHARVSRTVAVRLSAEVTGIAVIAGRFGEETSNIITSALTKDERRAAIDNGEMHPVAGDEQVWARRH